MQMICINQGALNTLTGLMAC